MVCVSLEQMHITRIVIAHRLSTIKNCDRILVLNDGSLLEEGDYETLMDKKGLFYQMAGRQMAE
jgi:ATP-binding cassette subfamily C protein